MNKDNKNSAGPSTAAKKGKGLSLAEVARSVLSEAQNLGPKVAYSEPPQKLNPTDGPARGAIQDLSKTDNEGATGASTSAGAPTQKLSPNSDQGAVDDLGASATSNDEKTPAAKAVVGGRTSKVPGGKYPEQEKYNPDGKKIFAEDDVVEDEVVSEDDEKDDTDFKKKFGKEKGDDKESDDDDDEKDDDHKEPDGDECSSKNEELVSSDVIEAGLQEANVPEHMAALFSGNGASLSEEFKNKAKTIFESAIREVSVSMFEKLNNHYMAALNEAQETFEQNLSEQVDDYLGYVVEQWVSENEVAIESGLRSELTEDFISGLRNLFAENYIDIPEDKVDLIEALSERVSTLEEQLDTEFENNVSLRSAIAEAKRVEIFNHETRGLTDVQIDKLKGLAEGIVTSDVEEFALKLQTLKESYLTPAPKAPATSTTRTLDTIEPNKVVDGATGVTLTEGVENDLSPRMEAYSRSLGRQVNSPTYTRT
jgi:hypothetical protein